MVERVHRVLKERLMAKSACAADWMSNLPLVLLGLRTSMRDSEHVSPAHLLYGGPLRLPGEFVSPSPPSSTAVRASDFVQQLQHAMRDFRPAPVDFHAAGRDRSGLPPSLAACPSVFVRVDAVKRPLSRPYIGPFEVLQRSNKTYVLCRAGKPWTVSVDRLKPCFPSVLSAPQTSSSNPSSSSSPSPGLSSSATASVDSPSTTSSSPAPPAAPTPQPTSRYGRRLRPPARYSP